MNGARIEIIDNYNLEKAVEILKEQKKIFKKEIRQNRPKLNRHQYKRYLYLIIEILFLITILIFDAFDDFNMMKTIAARSELIFWAIFIPPLFCFLPSMNNFSSTDELILKMDYKNICKTIKHPTLENIKKIKTTERNSIVFLCDAYILHTKKDTRKIKHVIYSDLNYLFLQLEGEDDIGLSLLRIKDCKEHNRSYVEVIIESDGIYINVPKKKKEAQKDIVL